MALNKRVFILEDDDQRIEYFRELFFDKADLTIIKSCTEIDKFQPPYDVIFLDHDLGGRQLEDHEDCGLTFVDLIKDKLDSSDIVVIHSYNGPAAKRMADNMPSAAACALAPFRGPTFDAVVTMLMDAWAAGIAIAKARSSK